MQAALRQGEVRMTGLVDAVNDGVITIDADGKVVLFNRAAERLFGAPATEAIGGSVDRFIPRQSAHPGSRADAALQVADVHSGEVRELFGRRADGQEFPLEVSLSRHETERGPLLTAVAARRDRPADGPRRTAGARGARGVEPGEDRVPVAHEPRAAHAAERRARLLAAAPARHRRAAVAAAARPHPAHRERRRAPAGAGQRRARPVAGRVGPDDGHARVGGPALVGRGCAVDGRCRWPPASASGPGSRRLDGACSRAARSSATTSSSAPTASACARCWSTCSATPIKYNRPGGQVRGELAGRRASAAPCASPTRPRHGAGKARAPVRAVQPPRRRELEDRGHRHRPGAVAAAGRADAGRAAASTSALGRGHRSLADARLHRRSAGAEPAAPRRRASTARSTSRCASSTPRTTRSTSRSSARWSSCGRRSPSTWPRAARWRSRRRAATSRS